MTDTSKPAVAAVVERLCDLGTVEDWDDWYSQVLALAEDAASLISALEAERDTLKQINANLMGDDENVPRYTTRRLKQEIARAEAAALRKGGEHA